MPGGFDNKSPGRLLTISAVQGFVVLRACRRAGTGGAARTKSRRCRRPKAGPAWAARAGCEAARLEPVQPVQKLFTKDGHGNGHGNGHGCFTMSGSTTLAGAGAGEPLPFAAGGAPSNRRPYLTTSPMTTSGRTLV
jgi:hypothetical protein